MLAAWMPKLDIALWLTKQQQKIAVQAAAAVKLWLPCGHEAALPIVLVVAVVLE